MIDQNWYEIESPESLNTPALLIYPERIDRNIDLMIEISGDAKKLRPHIKTHKTAEIIIMQMNKGITKFKCATIAEAELLAMNDAKDVLLAMQPVGANLDRYAKLIKEYPNTMFSTIVDNENTAQEMAQIAKNNGVVISLFLDLNVGMNRTGIEPNNEAHLLFKKIEENQFLNAQGLHSYDGHLRNPDFEERKKDCDKAFQRVLALKESIEKEGTKVPSLVLGGSPSFPIHAKRDGVEVSPGTTLLWDEGYGNLFKEMPFLKAAVLVSRIISKPAKDIICLDLGHKAMAPEMTFPRIKIFGLEDSKQIGQSEEHLVIEYHNSEALSIGDIFYGIPMHICPTVAKYPKLLTVRDKKLEGEWKVAARDHQLNI
ncbi:D-TA family PLP-dependent enzyme [Eudoraea chungangensis]|uniref:D-TA family PLP-dependent enzyme n=1 Tax=Eudoraea chungangensis TaxID=1481905 RepID=UPI0023EB9B0C|nr:D-TA family PLP-dependent enzyme [Eudoraea chungangensis]